MPRPDPNYVPCTLADVRPGVTWTKTTGPSKYRAVYHSRYGADFKLVRNNVTGAVAYYKRIEPPPPISPAEVIDAEPQKQRARYSEGTQCWLIISGTWFLVQVVARTKFRMTIKTVTGKDAERQVDWAFGALLDFPINRGKPSLRIYERLRPLSARRP